MKNTFAGVCLKVIKLAKQKTCFLDFYRKSLIRISTNCFQDIFKKNKAVTILLGMSIINNHLKIDEILIKIKNLFCGCRKMLKTFFRAPEVFQTYV